MKLSDLKPAKEFAKNFGVKMLAYGPPGSGKTPLSNTAPNPVMLICEPGMLSMRDSHIPAFQAFTPDKISEFFAWFFNSNESRKFDTLVIDSVSQMAEIILLDEINRRNDNRKAYGNMSNTMMNYLDGLYFMQNKHVYLIAKEATQEETSMMHTVYRKRPYFPGNELNIKVPHRYDAICHIAKTFIPNVGETKAIRTIDTPSIMARVRTGNVAEFEQPDLANFFNKIMTA